MEAHRTTWRLQYAYARFLCGVNSTAGLEGVLEEVIAVRSGFRGLHLALARVYQRSSLESDTKHGRDGAILRTMP